MTRLAPGRDRAGRVARQGAAAPAGDRIRARPNPAGSRARRGRWRACTCATCSMRLPRSIPDCSTSSAATRWRPADAARVGVARVPGRCSRARWRAGSTPTRWPATCTRTANCCPASSTSTRPWPCARAAPGARVSRARVRRRIRRDRDARGGQPAPQAAPARAVRRAGRGDRLPLRRRSTRRRRSVPVTALTAFSARRSTTTAARAACSS